MSRFSKRQLPLFLVATLLAMMIVALWVFQPAPQQAMPRPSPQPPTPPALSLLAAPPDWNSLQIYQNTITREEFERLLTSVFTTGDAWRSCIQINETEALFKTDNSPTDAIFRLSFAQTETTAPRHWRTADELPPATPEMPLAG
ncbi:MAG TPA: hypothetical protein VF258_07560, partial [Luteolibacter sp.]